LYTTNHNGQNIGTVNYTVWSDVYICSNCNEEIVFWDSAVDRESGVVYNEFECPGCKSLHTKRSVSDAITTRYSEISGRAVSQKKRIPVLINYSSNGKRFNKKPDKFDLDIFERIDSFKINHWIPTNSIIVGDEFGRLKNEYINDVSELFQKRVLIVLS